MTSNRSLFFVLRIIILHVFLITIFAFLIDPFDTKYFLSKSWSTSTNFAHEEKFVDHVETTSESNHAGNIRKSRNVPQGGLFLQPSRNEIPSHNKSCAHYATVYDTKFDNIFWQVLSWLSTSKGNIYFYGAYYDNRNLTLSHGPTYGPAVRILGMMDWNVEYQNKTEYYCQLWFENEDKPTFSKVIDKTYIWRWTRAPHQPFLYTCSIGHNDKIPLSVSVVLDPCDIATNHLSVQHEEPVKKQDFAVCVKGLTFLDEDISIKLVEWIELLLLLGTTKIFMYEFSVHPIISKILDYYKSKGVLDVTPLTLPTYLPNEPRLRHTYIRERTNEKRVNELIPHNDCFYRNLYNYKFIALLDIDEIIVPLGKVITWKELVKGIEDINPETKLRNFNYISFSSAYFFETWQGKRMPWFPEIPEYMHILQHVHRSRKPYEPKKSPKAFFNTDNVLTLHNHKPIHCLGSCRNLTVNTSLAHVQHYKPHCPEYFGKMCEIYDQDPVLDSTVWKYCKELMSRAKSTLSTLRLI